MSSTNFQISTYRFIINTKNRHLQPAKYSNLFFMDIAYVPIDEYLGHRSFILSGDKLILRIPLAWAVKPHLINKVRVTTRGGATTRCVHQGPCLAINAANIS